MITNWITIISRSSRVSRFDHRTNSLTCAKAVLNCCLSDGLPNWIDLTMAHGDSDRYARYAMYGVLLVFLCNSPVRGYNLTCYTCTATVDTDPCVHSPNASEVVTCPDDEPFCRVLRVVSQYGDLIQLARGCTSVCKNHCGIWGEDVDEEWCHSCCPTKLCNTGNGAAHRHGTSPNKQWAVLFSILYISLRL
ncbi:uncharacterized protein [Argopecten irradians]|uniref:uncharacterized protein n=1 Tax=Argopecten irradians TaxID=31199 RepID=UPI00371D0724